MGLSKNQKKILEWIIPLGIFGLLYVSGLLPEVQGALQSLIVRSGAVDQRVEVREDLGSLSFDFTLEDQNGNSISSTDFQGKTVFINLWATWCGPCIAEMPDIEDLYQEIGNDPDVMFVMLNLDQNREKAVEFIERKEYQMPIYYKASALPPELNVRSIPTTFVIDPEGKVIFRHSGIAAYNNDSFISFLKSNKQVKNS